MSEPEDFQHAMFKRCSQKRKLVHSFQVKKYWDLDCLQILWVCPECAAYMFKDFEGAE